MTDNTADTDEPSTVEEPREGDDDPSRRRLIRWIAVLAFAVPVVVEVLTFGGLLSNELLPGGDGEESGDGTATSDDSPTATATATPMEGAVGVGDELIADTQAVETIEVSEVRGEPGSRTYILRVTVENTTDAAVELRLTGVTLHDGTELDSVSSTGAIPAGEAGEVTGAWQLPMDSMPASVDAVLVRDDEVQTEQSVPLKRPPIRG